MKKHLCLLLAAILLLGGLAGCGPAGAGGESSSGTPNGASSSGEAAVSSASAGTSESDDSAETQRYQIADDVYITPVKADKPPEQLSDEEIEKITNAVFEQATLVWENLLAGVPYLEVDETNGLEYDGDEWYSLKYIHSFSEYQTIVESVFAKSFYSDLVYRFIDNCMIEREGLLYLCTRRVGGVSGNSRLEPLGITKIVRGTDSIQVSALIKNGAKEIVDGEYQPIDGVLCYTLLRQDGNWVLQHFRGHAE